MIIVLIHMMCKFYTVTLLRTQDVQMEQIYHILSPTDEMSSIKFYSGTS